LIVYHLGRLTETAPQQSRRRARQ